MEESSNLENRPPTSPLPDSNFYTLKLAADGRQTGFVDLNVELQRYHPFKAGETLEWRRYKDEAGSPHMEVGMIVYPDGQEMTLADWIAVQDSSRQKVEETRGDVKKKTESAL